jgi:hypothetical protein
LTKPNLSSSSQSQAIVKPTQHIEHKHQRLVNMGAAEDDGDRLADEAFDEWRRGRCRLSCQACQPPAAFTGLAFFQRHLRRQHGGLTPEDHDRQFGPALVEAAYLRCPACRVEVLHDYVKLKEHAASQHQGQDLLDYFLDFFFKGGPGVAAGQAPSTVAHKELGQRETNRNQPTEEDFAAWQRGCVYRCRFCASNADLSSSADLRVHLLSQHASRFTGGGGKAVSAAVKEGLVEKNYTK